MPFSPGDHVHIATLGNGVVRQVRNGDRYLVELKGRAIVVDGAQLSPLETPKQRRKASTIAAVTPTRDALARASASTSLDLHGMTTIEAVEALGRFLNDAVLAGLAEVRVIHGRGGGRLKAAAHGRLRELAVVRHFHVDRANPGVTIVEL